MEGDEDMVFATGRGTDWWTTFLPVHRHNTRSTEATGTLGVQRGSHAHTTTLAASMVEHGRLSGTVNARTPAPQRPVMSTVIASAAGISCRAHAAAPCG
nr:hypothetical protein GCM10020063_009080 [Dactylosporangium thailandense]